MNPWEKYQPSEPSAGPWAKYQAVEAPVESRPQMSDLQQHTRAGMERVAGVGEAVGTIGSAIAAEPISGLAGIAGAVAGMVPGGESPSEKGARFVEGTREALTHQPQTETGQSIVGAIGKGGEMLTKAVRAPVAGLAGLAQLPRGVDAAAGTVRRVMDEGIGKTAGGAVLDATGSPGLAAAAETIPTGIATVAGARSLRRTEPQQPQPRIEPTIEPRQAALDVTEPMATVGRPAMGPAVDVTPSNITPYETIVSNIKKGKTDKVAEAVIPDRQVVESAQRLGVDLNPEHYATNTGFQDVARALKARPGSKLQKAEAKALADLGKRADDVVEDIGGSLDKASVSDSILTDIRTTIDDLSSQAETAYNAVNDAIPKATRVSPQPIRKYLDAKLADLGGDQSLLSASERQLLTLVRNKEGDIAPTYAALDRVRRNVGNGFKNRGPFADDDGAILGEVYGLLTEVQDGVARSFGVGETYALGKQLVSQRKGIEDAAIQLYGKNLSNSLVPKMRSASTGLAKGDVGQFHKLMHSLPEARRGEVAATVLGDLFSGGSRRGGELGQGFVPTWQSLNRNRAAKEALFRYLPKESRQRFDDIGRVMTAIVRANQKPLANPSGSAGPIIKALEDGSAMGRIYQTGKKIAAAEGASTAVGIPGAGTAGVIGTILARPRTPIVVSADEMLSSPAFARSVETAAKGQTQAANRIIENSRSYKQWHSKLDKDTQEQIAKVGFLSWLISENQ